MNMLTVKQEKMLEDMGFITSDESFLYAGFDDVIRGNLKNLKIESLNGKTIQCETKEEFVQNLVEAAKS